MDYKAAVLASLFVCLVLNPGLCFYSDFYFSGFVDSKNNLSLSDGAHIHKNGILELTNNTRRVKGHAFYSSPIQFKNKTNGKVFSFSTAFAFSIVPQYKPLGGHGFAFTISPSKDFSHSLPSPYLGLLNSTNMGNSSNRIVAVEFDTVKNFEFNDVNDNHVGIDINSLVSRKSVPAAFFDGNSMRKSDLNLTCGKVIQAWIDYDSNKNHMEVRLSLSDTKPLFPILEYYLDLSPFVDDYMFVGFSSSTGLLASTHYVLGWSFTMKGVAKSLTLSSLPSLPGKKGNQVVLIVSVSISIVFAVVVVIALAFYFFRKIKSGEVIEEWEYDVGPHRFSYRELKKATRGFRDKELLGFGAFGKVYKGTLQDSNTQVAVKRISNESRQGLREFASEITSIGRLRHRNLVQLLGWGRKGDELLLVYDYMPNGSLDRYLFDEPRRALSWEQRVKILKGVASGLLYLHEEWEQTVIHRDIKAANVLLDSDMNGRLGDFGLAKLYDHGTNPTTTRVVGTLGYLAPELTRTGKPNKSSDVYAFGALILEVVCGRRPIEPKALPEELFLVEWVWDKWTKGVVLDVIDQRLNGEFDEVEAFELIKLGLMCSNDAVDARPTTRQVARYLEGEAPLPTEVAAPVCKDGRRVNHTPSQGHTHSQSEGGGEQQEELVHSYAVLANLERVSTGSSDDESDHYRHGSRIR